MRNTITVLLVAYLVSYGVFRSLNIKTWKEDGQEYMIFPARPIALYYIYRPLTYLDGAITGMRFHIGPHQ